MEIRFTVPAVPVAQPRMRASAVERGGHTHVHMHTPTSIKQADGSRKPHPIVAFKGTCRIAFEATYKGPPFRGPLRCDLTFVMPRPKSMIWKTKPMPRVYHTGKLDRDNLDKAVLDALTGHAWVDDGQVCSGFILKVIASGDEQPRVLIRIMELE